MSIVIDNPTATVMTDNHTVYYDASGNLYRSVLGSYMESFDGSLMGWRSASGPVLSDYGSNFVFGFDATVVGSTLAARGTGFTNVYPSGGQQITLDNLDNCRVLVFKHPSGVTANYSQILSGDWTGRVWVEFVPGATSNPQIWLNAAGGVFASITGSRGSLVHGQIFAHPYTEGVTVMPLGNGDYFRVFGFSHDGSWENLIGTTTAGMYAAVYRKFRNTEYIISGVNWFVDGRGFPLQTILDSQLSMQHWNDNVYIGKEAA